MQFKIFFLGLIFLFLSACASQATEPAPTSTPLPTFVPATPTPSEPGCSTISAAPTPAFATGQFSTAPDDFMIGPANAPATIMEYCDLQSTDCHGLADIMNLLLKNHPGDMRLIVRPIPLLELAGFENSQIAVQAVIAAQKQGKYLEVYNLLYEKYDQWAALTPSSGFENWLKKEVPALGLDPAQFEADLKSKATLDQMTEWYNSARKKGVQPPYPLVLVNGLPVNVGLLNVEYLDTSISLIALGTRQFTACPSFNVETAKQYIATIHTEKGDIVLQLFPDKAPLAVNSFVFLARQGWFNGVTFHYVIPGFVAQAGDPSGTGQGNPGYFFKNETSDLKFDKPGMVGMANSGPDLNGSQFFITYAPAPHLDGKYTIFGQVIQGMDVVEKLAPRDPKQGNYLPPGDKILSAEIEEK